MRANLTIKQSRLFTGLLTFVATSKCFKKALKCHSVMTIFTVTGLIFFINYQFYKIG